MTTWSPPFPCQPRPGLTADIPGRTVFVPQINGMTPAQTFLLALTFCSLCVAIDEELMRIVNDPRRFAPPPSARRFGSRHFRLAPRVARPPRTLLQGCSNQSPTSLPIETMQIDAP
jgi:hypothetical protein